MKSNIQKFVRIDQDMESAFERNCARECICFQKGTPEENFRCWKTLDLEYDEHAVCSEHTGFISGAPRDLI